MHHTPLKKADLVNSKSEVDELDVDKLADLDADKLKPVSVNLERLSDLVKNNVVKKTVCNEFVKKVNAIDTSKFVKK